ncbi:MAG: hypothetical protein L3K14_00305 [Thermoplasmata archaeon]|nr:hypothetical protein [Thermoplasmata archaeon]
MPLQTLGRLRRLAADTGLLSVVLALVEPPGSRRANSRPAVDEIIGQRTEAILLTRTAPPGPRWIEVSRWEDLVKASDFMGRPILRLDDGTRSSDQPLFYIPDGPQSFVFDFRTEDRTTSISGAYALPPQAAEAPLEDPPARSALPVPPRSAAPPAYSTVPTATTSRPSAPVPADPPVSKAPIDDLVEQYLGPNVPDPEGPVAPLAAAHVEREIRGMINDLLSKLRDVPPSSNRLESGTYHVERAIDLLRFARYGQAQIELNRAARLIGQPNAP